MDNNGWRNTAHQRLTLEAVNAYREAIVFDTETTGLDSVGDRIIEIAAIKFSLPDFKEIGVLHKYLRPPFNVPSKIEELTGITNDMLADKPYEKDVYSDIQEFFGSNPSIVVAHNSAFDMRFLTALAERNKGAIVPYYVLDTLEMARDRVSPCTTTDYKLGTLAHLFGLDNDIQFHSAIDDVKVTAMLFEIFVKEYQEKEPIYKTGAHKPKILGINFWEGYKGFSRIYVRTDVGSIYYDIRRKYWYPKDVDLNAINMEYVEAQCLLYTGTKTIEEFSKFRG